MKKFLLTFFLVSNSMFLLSDMVYSPITNQISSSPESPEINQVEYNLLFVACRQIAWNIKLTNGGKESSNNVLLEQFSYYLKNIVRTPTAMRFLDDYKKNKVFYPNGSLMRLIDE